MELLELTPEEAAFLAGPHAPDPLQARFARRLGATLTARLRLRARVEPRVADAAQEAGRRPRWRIDAALATLWLTRRLGGQRVDGRVDFVAASLQPALDGVLAECWLDAPADAVPAALAWRIATSLGAASLAVDLPTDPKDMTRWAREVIQHG